MNRGSFIRLTTGALAALVVGIGAKSDDLCLDPNINCTITKIGKSGQYYQILSSHDDTYVVCVEEWGFGPAKLHDIILDQDSNRFYVTAVNRTSVDTEIHMKPILRGGPAPTGKGKLYAFRSISASA